MVNETTETLPPVIGWLTYIVKWSPRITAQKPVYSVKIVPLEGSHGRRAVLVETLLQGHMIRMYADARDIVLDGRA